MPRGPLPLTETTPTMSATTTLLADAVREFVQHRNQNPLLAEPFVVTLLPRLRAARERTLLAETLRHYASLLCEIGRPREGYERAGEALKIFEGLRHAHGALTALAVQGNCLSAQGLDHRALRALKRALRIARENGFDEDIARLSSGIGSVYRASGGYERALQAYREGMRLASRFNQRSVYVSLMNNLGLCALDMGHIQRAHTLIRRAVRLLVGDRTVPQYAYVLHSYGTVHHALARYEEAGVAFEDALATSRQRGLSRVERVTLRDLAKIHLAAGRVAKSEGYLNTLQPMAESASDFRGLLEIALLRVRTNTQLGTEHDVWTQRALKYLERHDEDVREQRRDALALEAEIEALETQAVQQSSATQELSARLSAAQEQTKTLVAAASTDSLTGLLNRRALDDHAVAALRAVVADNEALSIMMFDVDHFKLANDAYGHQVGDRALIQLVASLRTALRARDMFFRYGGDEFVVLCPGRGSRTGVHLAEDLLRQARTIRLAAAPAMQISISIGAVYIPAGLSVTWPAALKRADDALRSAKRNGRMCVSAVRMTPASLRQKDD
jgi:diguanylate cyclase (GGDEF)-like protein